eukprot:699992-Alexandrium_andersonii.AAC.1
MVNRWCPLGAGTEGSRPDAGGSGDRAPRRATNAEARTRGGWGPTSGPSPAVADNVEGPTEIGLLGPARGSQLGR